MLGSLSMKVASMRTLDRRAFLGTLAAGAGTLSLSSQTTEVAVIGAGAFGGWSALYLREMGASVTLTVRGVYGVPDIDGKGLKIGAY